MENYSAYLQLVVLLGLMLTVPLLINISRFFKLNAFISCSAIVLTPVALIFLLVSMVKEKELNTTLGEYTYLAQPEFINVYKKIPTNLKIVSMSGQVSSDFKKEQIATIECSFKESVKECLNKFIENEEKIVAQFWEGREVVQLNPKDNQ